MTVALRADASAATGIGHVKRCLALAEALVAFGETVIFVAADGLPPALAAQVSETCDLRLIQPGADDAAAFLAAVGTARIDCVVVDHYGLDAAWHEAVAAALHCRLAAVDDLADRRLRVDVLIDHNLAPDHRQKYVACIAPGTRVLGGPRYALVSPKYAALPAREVAPTVRSIGISLGGTDPAGLSTVAVAACRGEAQFDGPLELVTTAANPGLERLRKWVGERRGITLAVDLPDLTDFHQRHDLYIGAGGGSAWERCCLGAPVLLLEIADNQRVVIAGLVAAGAAAALPPATAPSAQAIGAAMRSLIDNHELRRSLAAAARALVDGRGAVRVASSLLAKNLVVRRATADDCRTMYDWRNHPETRRISRDSRPIDWPDHRAWVDRTLGDPERLLLVGLLGDVSVGVIRFDRLQGEQMEVSLYLDPGLHGTGLGGALLAAGESAAIRWSGGPVVFVAHVLCDNAVSGRMFRSAGYAQSNGIWMRRAEPALSA